MIRLYIDKEFRVGDKLELPSSEWRYFQKVHRAQGEAILFNRAGWEARGRIEKKIFSIESVERSKVPTYRLQLRVALPENSVIPNLIRIASELGAEELKFFEGARSQFAKKRSISPRWEILAIESARQCGRGIPLKVDLGQWPSSDELKNFDLKLFLDEAPAQTGEMISDPRSAMVMVGCEGGWSETERDRARQSGFSFVHLDTPILKVDTATASGALLALRKLGAYSL